MLITQIKAMREELQKEQKLTTRYRKLRDRYKTERQSLFEKVSPDVEMRDTQKNTLDGLRKRRDFLKRQAKNQDAPSFKILTSEQLSQFSLMELTDLELTLYKAIRA